MFIRLIAHKADNKTSKKLAGCVPVEFISSLGRKIVRFENVFTHASIDVVEEGAEGAKCILISEPYNNDNLKNEPRDNFRYGDWKSRLEYM